MSLITFQEIIHMLQVGGAQRINERLKWCTRQKRLGIQVTRVYIWIWLYCALGRLKEVRLTRLEPRLGRC